MPYDDPDPTDPMTLHGVAIETESEAAMVEMAESFIEEYARLGFDADRILKLFHTRGYAGPALALQTLGEDRIQQMIADEMALRGPRTPRADSAIRTPAGISLPVLEPGC